MNLACRSRASLAALLLALLWALAPGRAWAQVSAAPPAERCALAREQLPAVADAKEAPAVEVVVSREQGHWLAALQVRYANGSSGTRRISARSCTELQRAVTLTLSLLDAATALPEPERSRAEEASAERAAPLPASDRATAASAAPLAPAVVEGPQRVAVPPPAAVPALAAPEPSVQAAGREADGVTALRRRAPRPLTGFLRGSSLVAIAGDRFGELGAALASGAWLGPWGARVELSARRPLAKLTAAHDFTLQLERYAAALEPCARLSGAVELALCGGPRLELLRALAVGPSAPASDLAWLPGMGGGSWLRLPVSDAWALSAELQASWSLRRAQASVEPWGKVYELPRFGAGLLLGAEWAL